MAKRILTRPGLLGRLHASMSGAVDGWSSAGVAPPHNAATTRGRFSRWLTPGSGPKAVTALSAPELVRRSRDMQRNNPAGKRAVDLLTTHIVGSGIRPRSLVKDDETCRELMALWDRWTKVSDADGTLDFYGQQTLAVREMVTGGESFARLRTRRLSDGLPVPLQIQLLPTEQVPLSWTQPNGPNVVEQGIERNPIGARVAYWVYPQHPGDPAPNQPAASYTPAPVDAADVCHLFNATDRIGQLRGLPWLAAAMTTLHQVNDYLDAELVRKQTAAMLVGFLLQDADEDGAAAVAGMGAVSVAGDGLPDIAMEPGAFNFLKPGQDVKFNTPADVGTSFDPFLRAQYRLVAAAAGVLYQELTGDWSEANDRTFRAMFNTFKRQASAWQFQLVCVQFNDPVWRRFVDYAVASGRIAVRAGLTLQDLYSVAWSPDRWQYIHPVQDIEATGLELALGLTSRTAAVAERGDDVEQLDDQIAADRRRETGLGLKFGSGSAGQRPSPGNDNAVPPPNQQSGA